MEQHITNSGSNDAHIVRELIVFILRRRTALLPHTLSKISKLERIL